MQLHPGKEGKKYWIRQKATGVQIRMSTQLLKIYTKKVSHMPTVTDERRKEISGHSGSRGLTPQHVNIICPILN